MPPDKKGEEVFPGGRKRVLPLAREKHLQVVEFPEVCFGGERRALADKEEMSPETGTEFGHAFAPTLSAPNFLSRRIVGISSSSPSAAFSKPKFFEEFEEDCVSIS